MNKQIFNLVANIIITATIFTAAIKASAQTVPLYDEPHLPEMKSCKNWSPQALPEKWSAIALMSPYTYEGLKEDPIGNVSFPGSAQLQVGKFIYDGKEKLMRVTRYGVTDNEIIDILIGEENTWRLDGNAENPQCLEPYKRNYKFPSQVWQGSSNPNIDLSPNCVGNHRTAPDINNGPEVDWWKQKSPILDRGAQGQAADWFWFDKNGYPTRTMFWGEHEELPAVLGEYAYSNFYEFKPITGSNEEAEQLKEILNSCLKVSSSSANPITVHQPTKKTSLTVSAETLIPGLSFAGCGSIDAPAWLASFEASSFSTSVKYDIEEPLPTSVKYDPTYPAIRTRLHKDGKLSDALLFKHNSFGIDASESGEIELATSARGPHTSLPGAPKSNWGDDGNCQCMATIEHEHNPTFAPNGQDVQIIACPLPDYSGNTLFWMWYTKYKIKGTPQIPIVFLQTKPDVTIGTGLSLADYTYWQEKGLEYRDFQEPTGLLTPLYTPLPPKACMGCHEESTNGWKLGDDIKLWRRKLRFKW